MLFGAGEEEEEAAAVFLKPGARPGLQGHC